MTITIVSGNLERDRHIARLYESGLSQGEVAFQFGMSTNRVAQILRAQGVASRGYSKEAQVHTARARQLCICAEPSVVRCPCGRRRCEDHAIMTSDGVRCNVCVASWD